MPTNAAPSNTPNAVGTTPRHLQLAIEERLDHGRRMAVELMGSIGEAAAASWYHEHEQYPSHERPECPLATR